MTKLFFKPKVNFFDFKSVCPLKACQTQVGLFLTLGGSNRSLGNGAQLHILDRGPAIKRLK